MKIIRLLFASAGLLSITLLISCSNSSSENSSSDKEELTLDSFFRYVKDQNKKLLRDGNIADDQNIFNSEYEADFDRWDFTSIDKNTGFRGEMYVINNAYSNLYGYSPSQAKKNIKIEAEEWADIFSGGIDDILDQIIIEKKSQEFWGDDEPKPSWAEAESELRDLEITLLESAKGKSLKDLNLYQWCCLLERNQVEFSTNCDFLPEHPHPFEYTTIGIPDRIALLEEDNPELISNLEDAYNDSDYDRDYSSSDCAEVREILQRNRVKQDRLISMYQKVINDGIQSISDADITYWNCGEESDEVGAFSSYSTVQFYNGENHDLYSYKYYAEPDTSTNKIIRGSYLEWNDLYNDIDSSIENGEAESVEALYDMLNTNDKFMMFVIDDANKKKLQMVWKWPETDQYSNRGLLYEFPINDQQASFFEDTWQNLLNKSVSTD